MAKAKKRTRAAGKLLMTFTLFGKAWEVRDVPKGHKMLGNGDLDTWGEVHFEDNRIYLADTNNATHEQRCTSLMHEINHIIEEHYCIDLGKAPVSDDGGEDRTDKLGMGWLYVIRGCPEVIAFVTELRPS